MKTLLAAYYVKTFGDFLYTYNIVSEAESVLVNLQTFNNNSFEVAASDMEALQNVHTIAHWPVQWGSIVSFRKLQHHYNKVSGFNTQQILRCTP